jgi:hypothetical protein
MDIEVEVRGKIVNFERTLEFFYNSAKFIEEKDRISFIYFREGKDVLNVKGVRDDPVDLKLRVTNKKAEMVMKYGRWGAEENRKEFLFPLELSKFSDVLEFFKNLDWFHGVIMDTKTFLFEYQGVEFALVRSGDVCYFEAEILVDEESEVGMAKTKILKVCSEAKLKLFEDEEFMVMMNGFNSREDRLFDMRVDSFEEIRDRFAGFF